MHTPPLQLQRRRLAARWHRLLGALACAVVALGAGAEAEREPLTVFAAASLTGVLHDIGAAYVISSGAAAPRISFAASSVLARQIEAGAPAEVFFSADQEWMDYLAARSVLREGTRRDIVTNRLVLIAPADSPVSLRIAPGFALEAALGSGRLATGDPDIVPAGRYAQSALMNLGAWEAVAGRLVRAENVRVALAYVARGEAPLGIVYATDALAEPRVRVIDVFPDDTHPEIRYPVAATRTARPQATGFIEFLAGTEAESLFAKHGFTPLTGPATP